MSAPKKPVSALLGVMAALLAGLFFASAAQADPYVPGVAPTTSVSSTQCGTPVTVSGTGYQPGETVTVTENGTTLGSFPADNNGSFSGSITIVCPNGTEPVTIRSTGSETGAVDSITITATSGSGGGGGSSSGSGGLSNTGVAVIGIGAVGVVLLVGGGLLLMAGKRRKVSV